MKKQMEEGRKATETSFFTADERRWTRIKADRISLPGYEINRHIRAISIA
jgi:hypothetical protein